MQEEYFIYDYLKEKTLRFKKLQLKCTLRFFLQKLQSINQILVDYHNSCSLIPII